MVKGLLAILLVLHGLIHAFGFVKAFDLAPIKEMSGKAIIPLNSAASKILGVLWLIPGIILITTSVVLLLNLQWWWILGLVGVVMSQIMIILYWKDAFAGSIANLLVIIGYIILTYTKIR